MRVVLATFAALGLAAASTSCRGGPDPATEHHHELNLPPVGPKITVSLAGRSSDVELSGLPPEPGASSVALVSVFKAAFPAEELATLHFDLFGSDGFHPMSRPKCARLLSGEEIAKAHLDPVTHNVTYDPDLSLPGCYRVKAVVRIEATR